MPSRSRRLGALLLVTAALVTACGSSSHKAAPHPSAATSSAAGGSTTTAVGVTITGGFGTTPGITVPATAAPTTLTQQVLSEGTGAPVAKGDTLIANYVGQTWAPKDGKANVFDSSFSRGKPTAFVIGVGQVIPGWDKTLVGKKLGSRVVLTVPPADGYGSAGQPSANISGTDTLIFVVDLVAAYKPNASAPGTAVAHLPTSDFPKITNVPGEQPKVLSTAGVKVPAKPTSTLVVTGSGAPIDSSKQLVVQIVQTDLATGRDTETTWGQGPQVVSAQAVLGIADVLAGQKVGSRAVVLLPASAAVPATSTQASQAATPPEIVILDVVGEF